MIAALSALQTWMQQHDPNSYRWAYVLILLGVVLIMREQFLSCDEKREADKLGRTRQGKRDAQGERR